MKPFKSVAILLASLFVGVAIIESFFGDISARSILQIFDDYARLILTSWPAAILIIGLTVLVRQHEAVAYFIKNRMTGVGLDGVKGAVIETTATDIELKTKTIQEEKEVKEVNKAIARESRNTVTVPDHETLVEDMPQQEPQSSNKKVYERLKKVAQIEEMVQTSLIERYGEKYRPQVKLTIDEKKSVIVDGLLYGKKENKATAIEIKYISQKGIDALKFIVARKVKRIAEFGIRRLNIVLIMDEIDEGEAIRIQEQCMNLAQIYFYKLTDDSLDEVKIPSRNKSLF